MSIKKSSKSEEKVIINRIKSFLSLKRDRQVADLFGIAPNDLSNRIKKGTLKKIAIEWALSENISLDWLIHGLGEPKFKDDNLSVKQSNEDYDLHGGWKSPSIEELTGIPKGQGMGKAVEMLADIYNSKNKETISSVYKVLEVFSKNLEQVKIKESNNSGK